MPVMLEFINILVPYQKIIKVYPGGQASFDAYCRNASAMWHDGYLVRFGAMNDYDAWQIQHDIEGWGLKQKQDFGFSVPWVDLQPEGFSLHCAALKDMPDTALVGPHNFQEFLAGKVKALRPRATILVRLHEQILLVRDRGKKLYSLPGGRIERKEVALAAAIRELHEELGMRANKAERLPHCDHEASVNRHIVCLIESNDHPCIISNEIEEYRWWDRQEKFPVTPMSTAL